MGLEVARMDLEVFMEKMGKRGGLIDQLRGVSPDGLDRLEDSLVEMGEAESFLMQAALIKESQKSRQGISAAIVAEMEQELLLATGGGYGDAT